MKSSTKVTIAPRGMSFDAAGNLQQGEHGTRVPPTPCDKAERALAELVDKIGVSDTGDVLADARTASATLDGFDWSRVPQRDRDRLRHCLSGAIMGTWNHPEGLGGTVLAAFDAWFEDHGRPACGGELGSFLSWWDSNPLVPPPQDPKAIAWAAWHHRANGSPCTVCGRGVIVTKEVA